MNLNMGVEGSSITRPPYFDWNNYSFWKTKITIFIQSLDYQLWNIIVNGPKVPTKTIEGVATHNDTPGPSSPESVAPTPRLSLPSETHIIGSVDQSFRNA
ncbi:hypothetical protein CFOL_v3_01725 [Cephalotus follicularis]|uniref:DUF4219 domain-containing protein n=1 Tax=Cephalotus follicularis TaxID=3775 RepID=A0A1Q3AR34_CEPFO|nr:hypothetical protein CFOL_v3_01725 [Cephalotus follicularis]